MKDNLIGKALEWARKKGFKSIKANVENFETPTVYSSSDRENPIIPDVTGVLKGRQSYVEIALKGENEQAIVSKWKLLCTLAQLKGGNLYLLAARGHRRFAEQIVRNYNLPNAKVVSI